MPMMQAHPHERVNHIGHIEDLFCASAWDGSLFMSKILHYKWSVVRTMLRFLRSKLFISLVLICLAFFLSFVVLPRMYGQQDQTVDIVMFVSDVNLGTRITENMIRTKTVGKYGLEMSAITDKNAIIGKYAAKDIDYRLPLLPDMFADSFEEVDGAVDTLIKPGQKLFTISTSTLAKSVAAQIKPGAKVDIYTQVIPEPEYDEWGNKIDVDDEVEFELLPCMTGVLVYKVQNAAGEDIAELTRKWQAAIEAGSEEDAGGSLIPSVVTLIVNDEQSLVLSKQEYVGTMHMALHPSVDLDGDGISEDITEAGKAQDATADAVAVDPAPVADEVLTPAA